MGAELSIQSLKLTQEGFALSVDALRVMPGEIVCVMGRSGSGKSTLLKAIAGFIKLDAGTVTVGTVDVTELAPERRHIALLFQSASLFSHYTVFKNIEFPLRLQKIKRMEREARVKEWLKKLEISYLSTKYPNEISGGEAQRVAFARALITGFPVMLLDEPFSSLDLNLRGSLRRLLRDLVLETKTAALLVTHDPQDARVAADRVHILHEGSIVQSGSVQEVFSAPRNEMVRSLITDGATGAPIAFAEDK